MKIIVCVGGNKGANAARIGVRLAKQLQTGGQEVVLMAPRGKVQFADGVCYKEYAPNTSAKTLGAHLAEQAPQLVISVMNLLLCEAAAKAKVPFIYIEHANFKEDKVVKNKKTILKKAKKVIVLTDPEQPLSKRAYAGLPVVEAVNPSVWVEHYNYNKPACFKKENNVLAILPLTQESGVELLLSSWSKLAPLHPTWHLTVAGDGALKEKAEAFIADNRLQDSVELVSALGDVYSLLRHADIFAHPSGADFRADMVLDAMASKLPCVAAESEQVCTLMTNGVNGLIVNEGEEDPFTQALDELMVHWGRRVEMAVEAAKLKDQYPFDNLLKLVEAEL